VNLGNIALRRGQREQALNFYVRARDVSDLDLAMREVLIKQIDRVSREPLDVIPPVRGTARGSSNDIGAKRTRR